MAIVEGVGILGLDRDFPLDRFQDRDGKIDAGQVGAAVEVARREHVHLEDLVPDDVHPDEEHAVSQQLGPDESLRPRSSTLPISTASALPPAWMLDRMSSFAATRRSAAYLPSISSGRPFIRNRRMSPFFAAGT